MFNAAAAANCKLFSVCNKYGEMTCCTVIIKKRDSCSYE